MLSEWRGRASYQTPAAALFARLLKARHDLAASECAGHVTHEAVADYVGRLNDVWIQGLREAQRQLVTAGFEADDTKAILVRVYDTIKTGLGKVE